VPVDYVADGMHELATRRPEGTFHLAAAGPNATTVGWLIDLASAHLGRRAPVVLPPRLYERLAHPLLRRRYPALRGSESYFPYFSMRVRFATDRFHAAPPVESYFHRLIAFAEGAGCGSRGARAAAGRGVQAVP